MKLLLSFAAAGLVLLAGGGVARAQHGHGGHGGHGFGHGGYGHGFGHGYGHGFGYGGFGHGYGHGYGHLHGHIHVLPYGGYYGSYGYPYTYGSAGLYSTYYPPVVATPVVPRVPAAPVVGGLVTGNPSPASPPANPLPAYTGLGVTLRLPAEFPNPVYVRIDGRDIAIKPGTEVTLKDKATYLVEFDQGGNFGTARHELKEGSYKMAVGDKGWDVVPDGPAPADGGLRKNSLPGEPKK